MSSSRLLGRRLVAENSRFQVFFDHLVGPDGSQIPDYLTVRPRVLQEDLVSGICVLPEVDGRIGLMRSHRHILGGHGWQAPAGFSEEDEEPAATALRELEEETGFKCPSNQLVSLGYMLPDAGVLLARVALFVARGLQSADLCPGDLPTWEPGWGKLEFFGPDELGELLMSDSDIGGATLAAGFRYLHLLAASPFPSSAATAL